MHAWRHHLVHHLTRCAHGRLKAICGSQRRCPVRFDRKRASTGFVCRLDGDFVRGEARDADHRTQDCRGNVGIGLTLLNRTDCTIASASLFTEAMPVVAGRVPQAPI